MTRPRHVAVVPHTHWDREWYEPVPGLPAQAGRHRRRPARPDGAGRSYTHFLLDGQLAVVDDYLEIRPENEDRLRALAAAGRITVGPWYILMDEFLVSGETIVRNLQAGIRRGSDFGGVMEVGYLPDMFGHVAQMPQILSLGRVRPRRGLAGRALGRRPDGLPVVRPRRLERAGRVPGGRLRQRRRPPRRRQGAGAPAPAPSTRSSARSSTPATRCC